MDLREVDWVVVSAGDFFNQCLWGVLSSGRGARAGGGGGGAGGVGVGLQEDGVLRTIVAVVYLLSFPDGGGY